MQLLKAASQGLPGNHDDKEKAGGSAPTWGADTRRCNYSAIFAFVCVLSTNQRQRARNTQPTAEKSTLSIIKALTALQSPTNELYCREKRQPHLVPDDNWILTMTLEELRGQESTSEASDR